jgi:hypothetical protein
VLDPGFNTEPAKYRRLSLWLRLSLFDAALRAATSVKAPIC